MDQAIHAEAVGAEPDDSNPFAAIRGQMTALVWADLDQHRIVDRTQRHPLFPEPEHLRAMSSGVLEQVGLCLPVCHLFLTSVDVLDQPADLVVQRIEVGPILDDYHKLMKAEF